MESDRGAWPGYVIPVLLGMAVFAILNGVWSLPDLPHEMVMTHSLVVYLGTGLLALFLLWRALATGRITRRELGLDLTGWSAPRRLIALAMTLFMAGGGFATLQPPTDKKIQANIEAASQSSPPAAAAARPPVRVWPSKIEARPLFGDYCFWFMFLLGASQAELLVFVSLGYCLTERWLKRLGWSPILAGVVAALFTSVAFGVYHYTHPPRWWEYALYPLIPVMLLDILCFVLTRNFWLTLLLHNAFAAVGFTGEQWSERLNPAGDGSMEPSFFLDSGDLSLKFIVIAFVVPFLALHLLEGRGRVDPPVGERTM